jgi:aminoglycoside phosphotransferase (APT) family kinase protein
VSDWAAELVVDEPLARRLLRRFPELELRSLRPFAEGWDYTIWVVDEVWAFRFPRRAIAVPGVEVEIRTMPFLAPKLPLPVPSAELVGEPGDDFPWPFFGARLLAGRELGELALGDERRLRVAVALATFLRELHAVNLEVELPSDSNRRAEMSLRVPKTREQLAAIDALWERPASVDRILAEAEQLPPSGRLAVAHGDLHFRQLLAETDGTLTGVIDWVDLCRTDPAIDLAMYWGYFPEPAREAFLDAYGPVEDDQLLRARVVAFSVWAALAAYGHHEGNEAVAREAFAGLERASADRPAFA